MEAINEVIHTIKNSKKLVELKDYLVPTIPMYGPRLHACGKEDDGERKKYSFLKFVLLDYSNGKGDNSVYVSANINPSTFAFLHWQSRFGIQLGVYNFFEEKIMPSKEKSAKVTKLQISRKELNSSGEKLRNPWTISVEEGTGTIAHGANNGCFVASGSYKKVKSVFVSLSDKDYLILLEEGMSRLKAFECFWGSKLLTNNTDNERQICKITTANGLVEFLDKTDTVYNDKTYQVIGVDIVDFQQKKENNKSLFLSANLNKSLCKTLFKDICNNSLKHNDFEFSQEKIMPNADINGFAVVKKLKIVRSENNKQGESRRQPWFIVLEEGKAQLQEYKNGAKSMKAGTYERQHMAYICLSDKDMFSCFYDINRLIANREFIDFCSYAKQGEKNGNKE